MTMTSDNDLYFIKDNSSVLETFFKWYNVEDRLVSSFEVCPATVMGDKWGGGGGVAAAAVMRVIVGFHLFYSALG